MKETVKEIIAGAIAGIILVALLVCGFAFDTCEPPSAPEHFGQIEYCGEWWDPDDYEAMMAEREACLQEEAVTAQPTVDIVDAESAAGTSTLIKSMDWDADESYMLAKIAMAEAEGEDTEGKALVILVVLNRVWSDGFPDTIEEVIMEDGAFTPITNGRYDSVEPDEDCWAALDLVQVQHWDESQGATYFEATPEEGESTWHMRNLTELFTHGGHTFYTE